MNLDYLEFFLIYVAIVYTYVGLAAFFDIPSEITDWRMEFAKATTIVGVSSGIMLSLHIFNLHKKSRKVKEGQDDNS